MARGAAGGAAAGRAAAARAGRGGAGVQPSGSAPWSRAMRERASGPGSGASSNIRDALALAAGMLGAPGGAGAAHIVQFRPVGVERLGHELAPEGAEFGERLC